VLELLVLEIWTGCECRENKDIDHYVSTSINSLSPRLSFRDEETDFF
jgi:hypothetical protein